MIFVNTLWHDQVEYWWILNPVVCKSAKQPQSRLKIALLINAIANSSHVPFLSDFATPGLVFLALVLVSSFTNTFPPLPQVYERVDVISPLCLCTLACRGGSRVFALRSYFRDSKEYGCLIPLKFPASEGTTKAIPCSSRSRKCLDGRGGSLEASLQAWSAEMKALKRQTNS